MGHGLLIMANRERGEVGFEADGRSWTLHLGTNAMCKIEAETGKGIAEIGNLLNNEKTASMTLMRAVFWGSLQDHHPGTSIKDCSELMDELGPQEVARLIGEAFTLANPKVAKESRLRPTKATAE